MSSTIGGSHFSMSKAGRNFLFTRVKGGEDAATAKSATTLSCPESRNRMDLIRDCLSLLTGIDEHSKPLSSKCFLILVHYENQLGDFYPYVDF